MNDDQIMPPSSSQEPLSIEEWEKYAEKEREKAKKAFEQWLPAIAPWLFEFGSWLFGGLIAFSILLVQAPILLGPVDPAVIICATTVAVALPLDITGLFLLRIVRDAKQFGFEELFVNSIPDVGSSEEQTRHLERLDAARKRRETVVLNSSTAILFTTLALTLIAIIAALWHVAWWVGVIFLAMVLVCVVLISIIMTLSRPPETEEDKRRNQQYKEAIDKTIEIEKAKRLNRKTKQ